MKKRILSLILALSLCISVFPMTVFAAADRTVCPTIGCTVTYDESTDTYSHSIAGCPYASEDMFCSECGYLQYSKDDDDYYHNKDCSIEYAPQDAVIDDTDDYTPPSGGANRYLVKGVTYYNTNSKNYDNSTQLFIRDMLSTTSKTYLQGNSIAGLWQYLAYWIQVVHGQIGIADRYKKDFTGIFDDKLISATGNTKNTLWPGVVSDDKADKYNTRSTGLIYANSVANAASAMEKQIYDDYDSADGGRNQDDAVAVNDTLSKITETGDTYWMLLDACKTSGKEKHGHYQALGLIFSDFSVTTILPSTEGNTYVTTTTDDGPSTKTYASNVKNATSETIEASQEISIATEATASTEMSHTKELGFEESLSVETEVAIVTASITFTASQVISNTWTKGESTTDSDSSTYTVGLELPPYTNVMMKQTSGTSTQTTSFNCPVGLNFKVTIVEYTLDPNSNKATAESNILATFGGNARKDLQQRGVTNKSITDTEYLAWDTLYEKGNLKDYIPNLLAVSVPAAMAGAKIVVNLESTNSEVIGLAPIYPLKTINAKNKVYTSSGVQETYLTEFNMTEGEYLCVDNITLEGLNEKGSPYYGFSSSMGHWVLSDANGETLNNETENENAKLETDRATGYTNLKALKPGTTYLKYIIAKNYYSTASAPDTYTANRDLDKTAIIQINIDEIPFVGSVSVAGTLEGIVGDAAIPIGDYLAATVVDSTDKEVSRPVIWEAKELKGISVENNAVTFTEPGIYHLRAITGTVGKEVRSEWVEVTGLPERKLDKVIIPNELVFDLNKRDNFDLNTLQITFKDQYNSDWTNTEPLTWSCEQKNATIENGVLTVPEAGTYTVTASVGSIVSNTMDVVVADNRAVITFDANGGTGEKDRIIQKTENPLTLPAADTFTAPIGMKFKCWSIGNQEFAPDDSYDLTDQLLVVVRAEWEFIDYNVIYDANGGTGTQSEIVHYGDTIILPECSLIAPKGQAFYAWSINGTRYEVGDPILFKQLEDLTVQALWQSANIKDYTVTISPTVFYFDRTAKKPAVNVYNKNGELARNVDYKLTFKDNIEVGAATATVNGIGRYTGTVNKTFLIKENTTANKNALNKDDLMAWSGSSIKLNWGKTANADGYDIFFCICGKDFSSKPYKTIKTNDTTSLTISKCNKKALYTNRCYKAQVKAWRMINGKKTYVATGLILHSIGSKNTKTTNAKKVTVKKTSVTLKKGKASTISASITKQSSKKKLVNHTAYYRYWSSNTSVAKVSSKGVITATGTGKCVIYVMAHNGVKTKVTVTVK